MGKTVQSNLSTITNKFEEVGVGFKGLKGQFDTTSVVFKQMGVRTNAGLFNQLANIIEVQAEGIDEILKLNNQCLEASRDQHKKMQAEINDLGL